MDEYLNPCHWVIIQFRWHAWSPAVPRSPQLDHTSTMLCSVPSWMRQRVVAHIRIWQQEFFFFDTRFCCVWRNFAIWDGSGLSITVQHQRKVHAAFPGHAKFSWQRTETREMDDQRCLTTLHERGTEGEGEGGRRGGGEEGRNMYIHRLGPPRPRFLTSSWVKMVVSSMYSSMPAKSCCSSTTAGMPVVLPQPSYTATNRSKYQNCADASGPPM